ncbi:MAG: response regulator transcription factor [Gammaproteobacteria bacterium]|nr:response regulator transcription factor [Gammaproteobacteria bacterium]
MRLLLVEDDDLLGEGVELGLRKAGYAVDWVRDGEAASAALSYEDYDLLVLDLGLPKKSGLEVLKDLRDAGDKIPVMILTAMSSIDHRVAGLDAGADDYLTKPFDLPELYARLRALARRHTGRTEAIIEYADIQLNPAAYEVHKAGEKVDVSRREYAVLLNLLENTGRVMSREMLEQTMYGWGEEVGSNAVEVYVHHLRKKLGNDLIRTIRGIGYMIEKE